MEFSESQLERYSRQILLPEIGAEGQERLSNSKVLVVGAGGLGSPALLYLAAAGVGGLGVAEFDKVELSNLGRQILHSEKDVGHPKIVSATQKLSELNSDIQLFEHPEQLAAANIKSICSAYDFVIDGSDNFLTKYLINDFCTQFKIPFNIAGILQYEGHLTTVIPGETACFRCLFPSPPPPGSIPTCSSAGVLGPLAGIIGTFQASEALKFLTKKGKLLRNDYLSIDLFNLNFRTIKYSKDKYCRSCGDSPLPPEPLKDEYCYDQH